MSDREFNTSNSHLVQCPLCPIVTSSNNYFNTCNILRPMVTCLYKWPLRPIVISLKVTPDIYLRRISWICDTSSLMEITKYMWCTPTKQGTRRGAYFEIWTIEVGMRICAWMKSRSVDFEMIYILFIIFFFFFFNTLLWFSLPLCYFREIFKHFPRIKKSAFFTACHRPLSKNYRNRKL